MMKKCTKIALALLAGAGFAASANAAAEGDIAPPRCDYGAPHPDAPEELAQFSFLIGDFSITSHIWRDGAWSPPRPGPRARWNGWYGLGGMAVYDEWYDPDPAENPSAPRGVNVRFFDSEADEWQMMWISTAGKRVQDLRAEMREGKVTMWQVYPERKNFLADFTVTDDNHWHRISYVKGDAGEWVPQFKLAATRIPCEPAAAE